jgi:hypothetical protein
MRPVLEGGGTLTAKPPRYIAPGWARMLEDDDTLR